LSPIPKSPLRHFDATSASSTLARCFKSEPSSTSAPTSSTSLELSCPSAFPDPTALLFAPVAKSVRTALPCSPKVPCSGFGYPLHGVSPSNPWEPLSTPNTLGLRPSEPFSSPGIEMTLSSLSSAPALSYQTSPAWYRRSSGFLPPEKPSSFTRPGGLVRVGGSCSPGPSGLSGSPTEKPTRKASPFSGSPLALNAYSLLRRISP
jgi:hypothetical protein